MAPHHGADAVLAVDDHRDAERERDRDGRRRGAGMMAMRRLMMVSALLWGCPSGSEKDGSSGDSDPVRVDDSACPEPVERFEPLAGAYAVSALAVEDGCGEDVDVAELAPSLWAPASVEITDPTPWSFTALLRAGAGAVPSSQRLVCILAEDQTYTCVDEDLAYPTCMSDYGLMVLVWSLSGRWTSASTVEGTFTYDVRWTIDDDGANPCFGPCTTSWTFSAAL